MSIDATRHAPHATGAPPAIQAAIARAAQATGTDFGLMLATARRESSFDANARAATSSATGLYQFIEQTWLATVGRHGARHGLEGAAAAIRFQDGRAVVDDPATRRAILALRTDPEIAARMAGELTRENAQALSRGLGRAPTAGELYAAHVLGPGGALAMIAAARDGHPATAAAVLPAAARANEALFSHRDGRARSPAELMARLDVTPGTARGLPVAGAAGALPLGGAMASGTAPQASPQGPTDPAEAAAMAQLMLPTLRGMLDVLLSSSAERDREDDRPSTDLPTPAQAAAVFAAIRDTVRTG
jgi:hypothetical protein